MGIVKRFFVAICFYVGRMGDARREYKILLGKPEGTRSCGRPSIGWEVNIIRDLK